MSSAVVVRIVSMAAAGLAAAAVVLLAVAAVAALPRPGDLGGGVLSDDDRRALAAVPALRGADPGSPDPAVDRTDPAAVARAYLTVAHSLDPGDAGHTQRRAAGFAEPCSPAAVGVVVLDAPPPGAYRRAVVTALELAGVEGSRRGYRAALRTETARPRGLVTVGQQHALVVLSEGQDGQWRVVAETAGGNLFPQGGEIDFMEMTDHSRQSTNVFLHHGKDNAQEHGLVRVDATRWHNWAVEWTPIGVTTYVDGKPWWHTDNAAALPPGPMHLCIQLDWFPQNAAQKAGGAVTPSQMQVDWVRQYPLDAASPTAAPTSDNSVMHDVIRRTFGW